MSSFDVLSPPATAAVRARINAPDIADGADPTAVLNAFLPTVPTGYTVVFPTDGRTWPITAPIKAVIKPGVSFEFNGVTFKPAASWFHTADRAALDLSSAGTTTAVTLALSAGQTTFVLPAGVTAAIGDMLSFFTSTVVTAAITVEWSARVVRVNGTSVTIDSAPDMATNVTSIRATPMLDNTQPTIVHGLRIDLSACPELAVPVAYVSWGMLFAYMDRPQVVDCEIVGAASAGMGVDFQYCIRPEVRRNAIARFLCKPSYFDATGRLGYGVLFHSCTGGVVEGNNLFGCRHMVSGGGYSMLPIHVVDNDIVDDLSEVAFLTSATCIQLDAHAGCDGGLVAEKNRFITVKAAAYARARSLKFMDNRVSLVNPGAVVIATANERGMDEIYIARNTITGMTATSRLMPVPTTTIGRITIEDNDLDGGSGLWSGSALGTGLGVLRIVRNRMTNAIRLALFGMTNAAAPLGVLEISDNHVVSAAAGSSIIEINTSGDNMPIGAVRIERNTLDVNASAAIWPVKVNQMLTQAFSFSENTIRGAGATHDPAAGVDLIGVGSVGKSTVVGNDVDTDFYYRGAGAVVMPLASLTVERNSMRRLLVVEQSAAAAFGVGQWSIAGNRFGSAVWTGPGLHLNLASTTFWANSQSMASVYDNMFVTTSPTAVTCAAASTNNRWVFKRNQMGAATIVDNSNLYYSCDGNYTSRVQTGKGGTIGRADALYSGGAPLTGTWATGDKVWHPAPSNAAGIPVGWVCVAAGTPGTWRSFGVTV